MMMLMPMMMMLMMMMMMMGPHSGVGVGGRGLKPGTLIIRWRGGISKLELYGMAACSQRHIRYIEQELIHPDRRDFIQFVKQMKQEEIKLWLPLEDSVSLTCCTA